MTVTATFEVVFCILHVRQFISSEAFVGISSVSFRDVSHHHPELWLEM
jgi:hypothetical protein